MVREKKSGKRNFFQVREKSGNFNFSQGNLEKMMKVRKKSGNLRRFQKSQLVKSSENHKFYQLQVVNDQKHHIIKIHGLKCLFTY